MAKKSTKKELRRDIRVFNKINFRYGATKGLRAIGKHYAAHPPPGKEEQVEWLELLNEVSGLISKFVRKNIKDREMRIQDLPKASRGTCHLKD